MPTLLLGYQRRRTTKTKCRIVLYVEQAKYLIFQVVIAQTVIAVTIYVYKRPDRNACFIEIQVNKFQHLLTAI